MTSTQHTRAILWDMDGVIVDSGDYHYDAWKAALASEGLSLSREAFARTFGQRNDNVLRDLIGPDISLAEIDRIALHKETLYRQFVRERGIAPLAGVTHWLMRLSADGWRQAVASAAPRANVDCILDATGLSLYFGAITSGEDVTKGKPDPQVYVLSAERLGVLSEHCVVIEDAPAGLEGARRAGMRCVGVRSTHGHLEADIVVDTLEDLASDAFARLLGHSENIEP